jgi:hypothetical protein
MLDLIMWYKLFDETQFSVESNWSKNLRRRVYDALTMLHGVGILSTDSANKDCSNNVRYYMPGYTQKEPTSDALSLM